jgi:hypothetical protein
MKISEMILFSFFVLFGFLIFYELFSEGIGKEYAIFFGCMVLLGSYFTLIPKGLTFSGLGIIVVTLKSFNALSLALITMGIVLMCIEVLEMKTIIKDIFFQEYKKTPEKIDIPLFYARPKLSFKKRKELFGTYFMFFNTFCVKIKTEQGWQEFYYDNVNKRLIEK